MDELKKEEDILIINIRQASIMGAFSLLICFAFFALGYFLGQNYGINTFIEKAGQESLSDQIGNSLYFKNFIAYDNHSIDNVQQEEITLAPQIQTDPLQVKTEDCTGQNDIIAQAITESAQSINDKDKDTYYAPLIGYGNQKCAEQFVERWEKEHVPLVVKKHISKNTKGKIISWYQVITPIFTDKNLLQDLVKRIIKKENLKNITDDNNYNIVKI